MKTIHQREVADLADAITKARSTYYAGCATISDAEYDDLEDSLRSLDPNHPVLRHVGAAPVSGWSKVKHSIPMGSLNKAQSQAHMEHWFPAQANKLGVVVMDKCDGIAIALRFDKGKLTQAITRGDGITGEDITRNVRLMKGLPTHLGPWSGWVRGEIVCTKADFAAHFPGESNPRNTAAGTAKRQSDNSKCKHLTVIAFGWHGDVGKLMWKEQELAALKVGGFTTPHYEIRRDPPEVQAVYERYLASERKACDYDIDGLVITVNDLSVYEKMGERNNRPAGSVAYKFPHEAQGTTLRNIRWQVGNSGRVTPVAEFDPVRLAGASVKQASLHNIANIKRLTNDVGFVKGAYILVSRRNDVIPYVEALISQTPSFIMRTPSVCPVCSAQLTIKGEYLLCPNSDGCSAQTIGAMRRWIKKVGVLHFGDALLTAVVEAGRADTIGDLYALTAAEVGNLMLDGRRVGGAADRALASLHSHKELDLATFVGSLGIELCGRSMVKKLVDNGYTDLGALASAPVAKLAAVPGFGEGKAKAFRAGFDARRNDIIGILANGVKIKPYVAPTVSAGGALSGVAVCFTGVRDKALEAAIVAAGGRVASSVSKNVTILVAKDVHSTSGKTKKARSIGVEIITLSDMRTRAGM
tara:strand:+ start:68 stop:1987 length:1920 start_codon:yes stop_codon:yes gene_type:complete